MNIFFKKQVLFLLLLSLVFATSANVWAKDVTLGNDPDLTLLNRSGKAFAKVVKKASPAVVYIKVEKVIKGRALGGMDPMAPFFNDPFFERFFGPQFKRPDSQSSKPREFKQKGAGSGFIISEDGYILTNNHVVSDADEITVRLDDEREFEGKVIGTDPQTDLALVKIEGKNLPVLPLGDSDALDVGEWVIAIGSPFELSRTVTVGVVSAKGRNHIGLNAYENFIQTDAAINPGNSGGPLLNVKGEVVGINTAIFSRSGGYMGIGFAIPVNMAKGVIAQLKDKGKVVRGWLGVGIQDIDEDLAESFNLDSEKGVLVTGVTEDSPAEKAGFKEGDVVIAIDGKQVANTAELRNKVAMASPGSKVDFTIIRDGKEKNIKVKIGEQPKDFFSRTGEEIGVDSDGLLGKLGLGLQDLTDELAGQFGYKKNQGVLISEVEPDSPAGRVGIKSGELIEEVNRVRVHNLNELKDVLQKAKNKKQVLLRISSGKYSRYVVLRDE